ncbi:MAG: NYN domain-containing protein [Actinobacteria bacterium]|nr:NYN domain-containing protein [Actinomycetota bacterium]
MGTSTRIFIDFWNFQLNWNDRSQQGCDWQKLPTVLLGQAADLLAKVGLTDALDLEETLVHASVKTGASEAKLRAWLQGFLDKQPSFRVKVRERRSRKGGIRCNNCKAETKECPNCSAEFERAPEKGVDAAIVTDLLSLAWERMFDVAIVLSSDADLIPAIERVQERGLKVVNATWAGHGYELAHTCWGSFQLDTVIPLLERPRPITP